MIGPVLRLPADTLVQTANIDFSTSGQVEGTGSFMQFYVGTTSTFTGTFNPFDESLGSLESVQLDWALNMSGTYTGATRYQVSTSGGLFLAEVQFSGTGGGNGGTTGTVGYAINRTQTFTISSLESSYPVMLSRLTGDDTLTARYASALKLDFNAFTGTETYTAAGTGTVTLTYTYAAVPEPATGALLAGIVVFGGVVWLRRRTRA